MKLSIITINYNNAEGLRKTLASVSVQTYQDIEHVIVDAASKDGSVDVIREYEQQLHRTHSTIHLLWSSEKDKGIYNAMNKGIEIALGRRVVNSFNRSELVEDKHGEADRPEQSGVENTDIEIALGRRIVNTDHTTSSNSLNVNRSTLNESQSDYIQILNSGDILAADDVTERMVAEIEKVEYPELLYGNMIKKDYATGKILGKSKEVEYSLRQYYTSTMNHDCCYIRCDVYDKYGLYDESLKIVSDWKWFLQAVGLGQVKPEYVDIDVTIFDASGISETNLALRNQERQQVLDELLPPAVLADYAKYTFPMEEYNRLKKYHLWGLAWFVERVFFKLEKWHILR